MRILKGETEIERGEKEIERGDGNWEENRNCKVNVSIEEI